MIVTIHQPNFIPWYPFFQKMEQADKFILLGNCQYEKNGFQNRFMIDNMWNTLGVRKGVDLIINKHYSNVYHDWKKIRKRLWKYDKILSELDNCISENLYETNKNIIFKLKDMLKINTPIIEDSPKKLLSSERLLILCKEAGATTYLAGQGGRDYLDVSLFEKEGIQVIFQDNLIKKHTLDILNG